MHKSFSHKLILILTQAGHSCKWVNDSQRLLLEHFDAIRDSPSQIYHSALPFSPSSSWLCMYYRVELSQEVRVVKGIQAEWDMCSRTVTLSNYPWMVKSWRYLIAVGCLNGNIIFLNGITGTQIAVFSGHTNAVQCLTFPSDGASFVTGSADWTIKLWEMQTGGVVKTFCGHTDDVYSVSISADSTVIVSGSGDKTIRLWDIQTGECCHTVAQQDEVHLVRFSPVDPQCLISVSGGNIRQWDISSHQILPSNDSPHVPLSLGQVQLVLCHGVVAVIKHFKKSQLFNCCCLFPGGRLVAVAAGNFINIWDITGSDPHLVKTFVGGPFDTSSLTFSPPCTLISSTGGRVVKFWQIGDLLMDPVVTDPKSTHPAPAPINSITLKARGGIAISSDFDGVISIWDVSTGLCKESFQTPAKGHHVGAGQIINGRLTFVWAGWDSKSPDKQPVNVWDVEKGEFQFYSRKYIKDLKISEDGYRFFSLQEKRPQERYIQAWCTVTGMAVGKVDLVYSDAKASLSVDGSRVWVYFPDSEPQGWDFGVPGSSPIQLPNIPLPHPNNTKLWDISQSRIKDAVTGKVIFQLGGRYMNPVVSQWDCLYFTAGYESGEVVILDFNHMFL